MKRIFDICASLLGLILFSPLMFILMILIWLQDYKSPFYIASRVAKGGGLFSMVKLRSMVMGADKSGVDSTSSNDMRITKLGHLIRRTKLDEIPQLWNVLKGDMSLVGPRPQVERDVAIYTTKERDLLNVRPGITDFSSIIFSDEGDILKDSTDPDLDYNRLIRPWKSRLGLLYIQNQSLLLDFNLIRLTILAITNKQRALVSINNILNKFKVDEQIIDVCLRDKPLFPFPPPGANEVVKMR